MRVLNRKLVRDIWRIRGQVVAIAAVMAAGVAVAVMSWGSFRSLEATQAAYYEHFRFAHVFAHATRAPLPLADRIAAIEGVRSVETRLVERALLDLPDLPEPARGHIVSLPETGAPRLNALQIRMGRALEPGADTEILVHELFAEAHGILPGHRLTMTVSGKRLTMTVVGIALSPEFVFVIGPGELVPDNRRYGVFWMARETMEAAFDQEGAFNDVILELDPQAVEQDVIDRVDALLHPFGGTGAYGRDDQTSDAFLDQEFQQLRTMAGLFPPIFLAVAAFLVNVVMGRIIATEREQIGVMKAFGYTDLAVAIHYMRLVGLIAALGILVGWAGGVWLGRGLTALYAENFRFPFLYFVLTPDVFAVTGLVGFGVTLAGAAVQVRKAARLAPAVAMKPPPPAVYGRSWAERLGLLRNMRPLSAMIVRRLTRWPVRSAITVLGVAASLGLLIMSLFFIDAVDVMLERYFFQSLRNDLRVTFGEVQSDTAARELVQLPGVHAAEPFRVVATRLKFGHRSERIGIQALDPGGTLYQHVDAGGRIVEVPDCGIMLNVKLANDLGVRAGDVLRVEALEHSQPVFDVEVTAIIEEFVGKAAYMARPELNRMMGDGPVTNGADLLIDEAHRDAIFAELKRRPDVEGVTVQSAALAEFRAILDRTMFQTLTFYILFGALIAFGVVYNAARIALSERARELASMRVLGFRKSEAAYVLVGELAALVLLALPIGCVFGIALAAYSVAAFETDLFRIPLVIDRSTYGTAVLVVLASAAVSAAIVVYRVRHLDLIGVLKTRE